MDMTITTVMTFFVIRYGWKLPLWLCVLATGFFFASTSPSSPPTC
jgi:KUP system potassium uptake protein